MEQDQQSQTTVTPPLGWLHRQSLPSDSTSSTTTKDESPRSTRSGLTTDPTVAVDALRLVDEDRQEKYGDYEENLSRIAGMWSAYLGADIDAMDVALMMVLLEDEQGEGWVRSG